MLEIKVTVELPGVPESIQAMADAISGKSAQQIPSKKVKSKSGKTETETPVTETISTCANVETPVAEAPAVPEQPSQPEVPPAPAKPEPKPYTLADISNAGSELLEQGLNAELFALLEKYSIKSLTAADPAIFPALAKDLIGLGAVSLAREGA